MKDENVTPEVTNDDNAIPDATKQAATGPKTGKADANWKKLYYVLGQFNATAVLRANENPECIPAIIDQIVACSLNNPCSSLGPGFVWDVPTQQCIPRE